MTATTMPRYLTTTDPSARYALEERAAARQEFLEDVAALADELGVEADQVLISTFVTLTVVGTRVSPEGRGRWTSASPPYRPWKSNTYWVDRLAGVRLRTVTLPGLPEATIGDAPGLRTRFRVLVNVARLAADGSVWVDCGEGVSPAGRWDGSLGVWREATRREWDEAVGERATGAH